MSRVKVNIKGIKEGLLVTPGDGDWNLVEDSLLQQIRDQAAFFNGARVALDLGNTILRAAELGSLRDKLNDLGISLWAVISNSPTTEQNAQALGLATRLSVSRPERTIKPLDTHLAGDEAVLVQRTLRSGFKVSFHGHVVVIGDVNPGAEIVAGGSIVVWGRLRGVAHAGAEGNDKTVVCALDLTPTQLRIAGYVAISPHRKGKPQPEIARVEGDQVIVENWYSKEGGK